MPKLWYSLSLYILEIKNVKIQYSMIVLLVDNDGIHEKN